MRTHYDNLKVPETATRDVIKTSYRKLCLNHHPDRNPGNADAERIMRILNDAYDVLSDPVKRRAYDQELTLRRTREFNPRQNPRHASQEAWKRHQDQRPPPAPGHGTWRRHTTRTWNSHEPHGFSRDRNWQNFGRGRSRFTVGMGILILVIAAANLYHNDGMRLPFAPARAKGAPATSAGAPSGEAQADHPVAAPSIFRSLFPEAGVPKPVPTSFTRPATAPNGAAWPDIANYVQGYPQASTAGESRVTLDNTESGADVFVKLIWLHDGKALQVRTCFLPAYAAFTLMSISPGDYELRYRNLSTGEIRKTEVFPLKQAMSRLGVEFTRLRLSLFKAGGGGLHSREILEEQF